MSSSSRNQPPGSPTRLLVNFYDPVVKGPDARGRTLEEILAWSDDRLETQHDYIQTLFPLPEQSGFNLLAPVVDEETISIFAKSPELKRNLLRALKRMLAFYGFDAEDSEGPNSQLTITPKQHCECGFSRWLVYRDHNHLRITRIIRSLRVFGLEAAARDFYNALFEANKTQKKISSTSISFWTRALYSDLRYTPDGGEVAWLKHY